MQRVSGFDVDTLPKGKLQLNNYADQDPQAKGVKNGNIDVSMIWGVGWA